MPNNVVCHDKACGASIPKDKITKFINTLNSSLAK